MITHAWNLTVGTAAEPLSSVGEEALDLIQRALQIDEHHLLAHHLRIHLLEAQPVLPGPGTSDVPGPRLQLALDSGHALRKLARERTGGWVGQHMTGHLLHMPAHVFMRVGLWREAIQVRRNCGRAWRAEVPRRRFGTTRIDACSANVVRVCKFACLDASSAQMPTSLQASEAALAQDIFDTRMGAMPFIPTHDVDMGVFTSIMAGDYASARMFATHLRHVHRHFPAGTYSAGVDVLTKAEVDLLWGRCGVVPLCAIRQCCNEGVCACLAGNGAVSRQPVSFCRCASDRIDPAAPRMRGRSSAHHGAFLDAAELFRQILCQVQASGGDLAHAERRHKALALAEKLASTVQQVCRHAYCMTVWASGRITSTTPAKTLCGDGEPRPSESTYTQVEPDVRTRPGEGIGIYSTGTRTIACIYNMTAAAAVADALGEYDSASRLLEGAVRLEHSMGYVEPPRVLQRLRPCLAATLGRAGRFGEAISVARDDLAEFPENVWGMAAWDALQRQHAQYGDHGPVQHMWGRNVVMCSMFDGTRP